MFTTLYKKVIHFRATPLINKNMKLFYAVPSPRKRSAKGNTWLIAAAAVGGQEDGSVLFYAEAAATDEGNQQLRCEYLPRNSTC